MVTEYVHEFPASILTSIVEKTEVQTYFKIIFSQQTDNSLNCTTSSELACTNLIFSTI